MARETAIIDLPQYPDESARAYRARVEYITMGPNRSLEKARQKLGKSAPGYTRQLAEWSERYGWVKSAQDYDYICLNMAAQDAADSYRADLADYRKRYGEMGKALYQAAGLLLRKVVKTADAMEVGPGALSLITNAAKTAADLEALALRVEDLLGKLSDAESGHE